MFLSLFLFLKIPLSSFFVCSVHHVIISAWCVFILSVLHDSLHCENNYGLWCRSDMKYSLKRHRAWIVWITNTHEMQSIVDKVRMVFESNSHINITLNWRPQITVFSCKTQFKMAHNNVLTEQKDICAYEKAKSWALGELFLFYPVCTFTRLKCQWDHVLNWCSHSAAHG